MIAPLFVELEFVKTIVAALMSPLDTPKSDAGLDTGSTIALLVVVLGGAGDALVGRDVYEFLVVRTGRLLSVFCREKDFSARLRTW